MAQMSRYCKAYLGTRLREFPEWPETERAKSAEADEDLDIYYVHEDLSVTRGVFLDEEVVLGKATDAWAEFCRSQLNFAVPDYATEQPSN
jgi:hypothetical protein